MTDRAEPTTPATGTASPPAISEEQLALSIGRAVLEQLRRASPDGRLPSLPLPVDVEGAALEPRPGTAAAKPRAPSRKPAPGTATIRAAIRKASDFATAPPDSDLARLRVAVLTMMLCLAAFAVLVVAMVE